VQVRAFGLAQRERVCDRVEDLCRRVHSAALFDPRVVLDADPGQHAEFLAPKAGYSPAAELWQADVVWLDGGPAGPEKLAEWERMIDTNLSGALRAIRAFVPALLAAGESRGIADLVNVSSVGSKLVFPTYSVYGATKAALTQLSADLRAELGPRNVRVTDLQPGLTSSELADNVTDPQARDGLAAMFDAIPPLSGDDIADLVSYLFGRPAHVNVATLDIVPTRQA
jgi:NADP-dependent 3-hydroxy acid dehydrogenase YdfG